MKDTRPAGAKGSSPQDKNQGEGDKASAARPGPGKAKIASHSV